MSDLLFENHGWDDDKVKRTPGCTCLLEEGDSACSVHDALHTLPSRVPTQPDVRLEPTTVPEFRAFRSAGRCYFCGNPAMHIINFDIPTCGKHGMK